MLYRILTENKNKEQVEKLVVRYCDSATVIEAKGLWQGIWENSLIIEIDDKYFKQIEILAQAIKELNEQEAVLIQEIACESYLI